MGVRAKTNVLSLLSVMLTAGMLVSSILPVFADTSSGGSSGIIADPSSIKSVVVSPGLFSLALKEDGTVWAWGYNRYGELGDGTTRDRYAPIHVPISGVKEIAAGMGHAMALKNDGTVWVWGSNMKGEHGNGMIDSLSKTSTDTGTIPSDPTEVPGLSGVKAIAAGGDSCFVLKSDGTVWAWGYNGLGELGDGSTTTRSRPVQVKGLADIVAISSDGHTLALDSNGKVWAWGSDQDGEVGNSTADHVNTVNYLGPDNSADVRVAQEKFVPAPVQVPIDGVKAVTAGGGVSMAIKNDGTVWAWGRNDFGQLGDGTKISRSTPAPVYGLNDVVSVDSDSMSMALKSDGTLWAWGSLWPITGDLTRTTTDGHTFWAYGNDSMDPTRPARVKIIDGVKAFSFSTRNMLVLKNDGTLWSWGENQFGEAGIGVHNVDPNAYTQEKVTIPTRIMAGTAEPTTALNVTDYADNTLPIVIDGSNAATVAGAAAGGASALALAYVAVHSFLPGVVTRAKDRLNKNENRKSVLSYIADNPGSTLREISRGLGMNLGTVRYHVFILGLHHRVIDYMADDKHVRYFLNSNTYSKEEQFIIAMMKREGMKKILALLVEKPGLTSSDLAGELRMYESAICRYTKELCEKGIIDETDSGNAGTYSVKDVYLRAVRKVAGMLTEK